MKQGTHEEVFRLAGEIVLEWSIKSGSIEMTPLPEKPEDRVSSRAASYIRTMQAALVRLGGHAAHIRALGIASGTVPEEFIESVVRHCAAGDSVTGRDTDESISFDTGVTLSHVAQEVAAWAWPVIESIADDLRREGRASRAAMRQIVEQRMDDMAFGAACSVVARALALHQYDATVTWIRQAAPSAAAVAGIHNHFGAQPPVSDGLRRALSERKAIQRSQVFQDKHADLFAKAPSVWHRTLSGNDPDRAIAEFTLRVKQFVDAEIGTISETHSRELVQRACMLSVAIWAGELAFTNASRLKRLDFGGRSGALELWIEATGDVDQAIEGFRAARRKAEKVIAESARAILVLASVLMEFTELEGEDFRMLLEITRSDQDFLTA